MSPYIWLGLAAVAGVAGYFFGVTALGRYRVRQARDENEERYRAWRGRAAPSERAPIHGMTASERRLVAVGGALIAVAIASLLAFFASSG